MTGWQAPCRCLLIASSLCVVQISIDVQFFGPDDHIYRPDGSVMASYLRHVNPFLRLYKDVQLHQVKMFVRTGLCNHVRTHGCDEGINGTADGERLPSAMGSNKVHNHAG